MHNFYICSLPSKNPNTWESLQVEGRHNPYSKESWPKVTSPVSLLTRWIQQKSNENGRNINNAGFWSIIGFPYPKFDLQSIVFPTEVAQVVLTRDIVLNLKFFAVLIGTLPVEASLCYAFRDLSHGIKHCRRNKEMKNLEASCNSFSAKTSETHLSHPWADCTRSKKNSFCICINMHPLICLTDQ